MMGFLIFMFVLGLLIIVHEFGHFIAARKVGVKVEKFSIGFGPVIVKKKKKDTEYCLSAIPLGGFVKLAGDNLEEFHGAKDEFFSKAPGKRFWIIFCGPLLNYFLGFLCLWFIYIIGYPALTTKIGGVIDDFGAQKAGLVAGDRIVAIDGEKVAMWEDLQAQIQKKKSAGVVNISIERNQQHLEIPVAIKEKEFSDIFGKKYSLGLLGVSPGDETVTVKSSFFASFALGAKKTIEMTVITVKGLYFLIAGKMPFKESVTGPLGIYFITSHAAAMGFIPVVHLIAVLSISLAIFNVLPLPVLDGGHILFLAIEKIRGKGMSLKTEQIINKVGFSLLITFAVVVTYNDIVRVFGQQVSKFFK